MWWSCVVPCTQYCRKQSLELGCSKEVILASYLGYYFEHSRESLLNSTLVIAKIPSSSKNSMILWFCNWANKNTLQKFIQAIQEIIPQGLSRLCFCFLGGPLFIFIVFLFIDLNRRGSYQNIVIIISSLFLQAWNSFGGKIIRFVLTLVSLCWTKVDK